MSHKFANETFRNAEPSWANACVGDNGSPDIVDYAEGFANAAQVLLEQVLRHRGLKYPTDTFVYPICFNMRHAIELYIKAAIESLRPLVHHDYHLPEIDVQTSHDIGKLWRHFKEHAIALDSRYKKVIGPLDTAISDFANIDATGQVFRYPFGRENQKHLTELAIINLGVLWMKFPVLIEGLKTLNYQGNVLGDEYRHGTYTARLSRFDLVCIAYRLPPRAAWGTREFDVAKAEIRKHFNISSNEFSRAVKVIEANIEMAAIIEAPRALAHVKTTQLTLYFDSWCKFVNLDDLKKRHAPAPDESDASLDAEVSNDDSGLLEEIRAHAALRAEIWPSLMANISLEALGEIRALYYFSRNNSRHTEEFERERELCIRDLVADPDAGEARLRQSAFYLMDKPLALEHVLNSLLFFGHIDVANEMLQRYELSSYASEVLQRSLRRFSYRHRQASEAMNRDLRHPANELFVR
ncbi:hypothetical protein KGP65_20995 [Burkholderia multivorans]|uniref:hypothetical protein n=1 Tax=Burkholderia multivorans TaxID=87883 RepID=UPI000B2C73C0|nr:hypothetical protein [Burkholderia multivorans]MBU9200499.1 hypothetical protein [Burkholderia multivorans]MCA8387705.1 hypothetical protein [Burkholderia multivorans]MCO8319283.1 hypothetical protein [Burkholderia multivorans]MCO8352746.1 hypothetical protein [Burkholderia multivorans]MCO8383475.1 hypothetical protein [Burkholderia multivorans]